MVTRTGQERFRTIKGVFDEFTERNLFELQSRNYFDQLLGPVKVGKESNVFLAERGDKHVIVKIYRIQNCDFKRMYDYIRKDSRYEGLKNKHREIIFAWTQREYKNLHRAQDAGINSPKPIAWKFNIIIEEMIGDEEPAPPLKDLKPKNPKKFFEEVIDQMEKLYHRGLIHGDLSAFNILNYNEKPYFIDYSQGTLTKTPNSQELLERDVRNILKFFESRGVKADFEQTFKKVTASEEKHD
jgi:RIO kinase 1